MKANIIIQVEITIKQVIEVGIPMVDITNVVDMIGIIAIILHDMKEEGKGLVK